MLKSKSKFAIRYTPEFRRQMVELVWAPMNFERRNMTQNQLN